jgi:hypothetical protein
MIDVKTPPALEHGMTNQNVTIERNARPQLFCLDVRVEAMAHLYLTLYAGCGNFNGFPD